jgi:hypothetical protein
MTKLIAYNRKHRDFDMWLNDEYVGSRATYAECEEYLDNLAYEMLMHGVAV